MSLRFLRSIFLISLPLASIGSARSLPERDGSSKDDAARWRQEVETVPGESLKFVVEAKLQSKYQEGIFQDGHHGAIAAIHSEDASVASRLVEIARQDAIVKDILRKRQESNTTVSAEPTTVIPPETSTTVPASTEPTTELPTSQGQSSTSSVTEMSAMSATESSLVVPTSVITQTVSSRTIMVSASSSTTEGQTIPATTLSTQPLFTQPEPSSSSTSTSVSTSLLSSPSPPSFPSTATPEQGSSSIVVPVSSPSSTGQSITTSASAPETTAPAPVPETTTASPTTQTGILVPIVTSTTADDGSVVLSTSNAFETAAQTSVAVGITSIDSNGQTMVSSTMAPATIITQTNSAGSSVVTTSPLSIVAVAPGGSIVASSEEIVTTTDLEGGTIVLSSPSSGATYTMTDSGGRIATVTYQPGGATVSQVRLLTTLLPNGQQSTITSFAEVGGATGQAGSQATGSASTDEPELQSGATMPSAWCAAGLATVGGLLVGVGLLW